MFDSLVNLTKNVVSIATAPIEIAVDITNAVVKPVADVARDTTKAVKEELTDDHKPK